MYGLWGFEAALTYVSVMLFANLIFCLLFIEDPIAKEIPEPRRIGGFQHFIGVLGEFVRNLYTGFMESGPGPKLGLLFALLPKVDLPLSMASGN